METSKFIIVPILVEK